MKYILECWKNTKGMPWPLGMLCRGGMVASPILLFFLLLPIQDWNVDGRVMSYSELWASGYGFIFALFFAIGGVGFWGLAARKPNARWFLVFTPIVPLIAASLIFSTFSELVEGVLGAVVIYACLFYLPAVKEYFTERNVTDE
jgi:hypothetical protein